MNTVPLYVFLCFLVYIWSMNLFMYRLMAVIKNLEDTDDQFRSCKNKVSNSDHDEMCKVLDNEIAELEKFSKNFNWEEFIDGFNKQFDAVDDRKKKLDDDYLAQTENAGSAVDIFNSHRVTTELDRSLVANDDFDESKLTDHAAHDYITIAPKSKSLDQYSDITVELKSGSNSSAENCGLKSEAF